ncbi:glycosyltransferase [Enterococcus sp. AZ072]|uniref:glycosyltransferase n=1 Tax=unclassified Enterococcus TaxID=2608891 RepID=UPI003D28F9A2
MYDIVIVLYQIKASESPTIQTLQQILTSNELPELRQVIVFDNSVSEDNPVFTDERFVYHFAEGNQGLAKAYNYVWPKSLSKGCHWLITLDQDTSLTNDYFSAVADEIDQADKNIAIIAPVIYDKEKQISPVQSNTLRPLHTFLPRGGKIYYNQVMVINSAAVISLDFLQAIGGYNETFSMDYLDHWLCWRIFQEKKQIKILSGALHHQLSVLDYRNSMNTARYQQILNAESRFYKDYATEMFTEYKKQLLLRSMKQIFRGLFPYAGKTLSQYKMISGEKNGDKVTTKK